MSTFLILDIGAGTLDLLYFDSEGPMHYKAVCRSPVLTIAEEIRALHGDILVTGREMGGGSVSQALKAKAESSRVVMSESSAATIHHDPERVRSHGIEVVVDEEAEALKGSKGFSHVVTTDVEPDRLRLLVEGLGVPFDFDVIGVCAQDHGVAPKGVSHLDYRHNLFRRALDRDPALENLVYPADRVPDTFNRLKSLAEEAGELPAREVYVMDSGMAAILGASLDPEARVHSRILVLDAATSHTVGASLEDGVLAGFFEYHTSDVTLSRLEGLLHELADGSLTHESVLAEGGHGAYIRKPVGFDNVDCIVAVGPKRAMVAGSRLPVRPGAPMGDNMMTGTLGVLEAVYRRKRLGSAPVD